MRALLATLLLLASAVVSADFAVVVHQDSPIQMLNEQQVASIFLGKTTRFPNGERATPLEVNDEQLRAMFYARVSGKSLIQLKSYWAALVFTGKGRPPKMFPSVDDLDERFLTQPGAITYLPEERVTEEMRVVYLASE